MIMVPPQHGHGQVLRAGAAAVWVGERGLVTSASNWRQTVMSCPRRRADRKPKWRMRTKPRGNTCSRNRRRNSSVVTAIFALLVAVSIILPPEGDLAICQG